MSLASIIAPIIVMILCGFAFKAIWQIVAESPADEVHRRQQRALRDHHRAMERDHQRNIGYWKGRGIKPRVSE